MIWPYDIVCFLFIKVVLSFSRMRSKGSRFTLGVWGWGCVRQKLRLCPQPFATVGNCPWWRREALLMRECDWSGAESMSSWLWRCSFLKFAEEVSVWVICGAAVRMVFAEEMSVCVICGAGRCLQRRCFILAFAEEVFVWVICGIAVVLALAGEMSCEWSVAPQLYWRLQRRCLSAWSVAPQLQWRLQRRCLCAWSLPS